MADPNQADPKFYLGDSNVEHHPGTDDTQIRWEWERREDGDVSLRFTHGLETYEWNQETGQYEEANDANRS